MKVIPIVFAFDDNMEMPAGVCMTSLLVNADSDTYYDIFILHDDGLTIKDSRISLLQSRYPNCRVQFRCVGDYFNNAYEIRGITRTAYFRLLAPSLIPEYDKLIYCDVDMIFRRDLFYVFEIDLDNYLLGGVSSDVLSDGKKRPVVNHLGIKPSSYINSGALLMNLQLMRKEDVVKKFLEHENKKYPFQDQDIINIVCKDRIKILPIAFNYTTYLQDSVYLLYNKTTKLDDSIEMAREEGTIHYNGVKPWKGSCPNMDIWWEYYRKSIFFDEKFTHDFWIKQRDALMWMPLMKRIKQLLRYPLDLIIR